MARILVLGGHGKVALLLERLLADRGDDVDALIRNPEHAGDVEAAGAHPVVADLQAMSADELAVVFTGHDAVVWSAGAGGGSPARTWAIDRDAAIRSMEAAAKAGVDRYVMVSYFGSSPDHGVSESDAFYAYAESKAAADEHLRGTDLAWTILGPSRLTDGAGTGRIDATAETSDAVDRADVAAVIAAVLDQDGTIGRTIRFNAGETPVAEAVA
ncbi:SDR family oxidoreductase [Rathayibacter sp. YIM 133350]|uniref:SDR family oxidoreductase n=1 Tax=Rathayibacter sp. YIM 133350 TaxID=3131992 RepID=UPI00307F2FE1